MKKITCFILFAILLVSCKNENNPEKINEAPVSKEVKKAPQIDLTKYPDDVIAVLDAHGGLQKWSEMKTLTFTLGEETHTTDLKSRDILIEGNGYHIGSDEGEVWIAQDSAVFPPQRARFYHNLMFYFYAMPFVLADDGIKYDAVEPLEMDGISFPGIKISYQNEIGDSPDDEYLLFYHPETKEMSWLGYTVTYGRNEKSDKFNFIKYSEWQEVSGLKLPKTLDWCNSVDGKPTVSRKSPRVFEKVDIDASPMDENYYKMPENGTAVE